MNRSVEPAELTVKAVGLGLFLAFVFGAANAYLGMRAGQTVSATIPAAVIAMALFRLPKFRGTLQEQNISRTAASVGEALVAGAIFTIPSFMLADVDGSRIWTDLRSHYWEATVILLAGGLIGTFFIILLRRALVVEANLPWPEGVACYEITRAGEEATDAPRYVFGAMGLGGLIQILRSDKGLRIFRDYVEGFWQFPPSVLRHFNFEREPIGEVRQLGGVPWSTPALSPALIGIGYIIGPRLASINVAGGIVAWWVLIPLLMFFDPDLPRRIGNATPDVQAFTLWYNVVRPIAVGAMLVAAANTMIGMRHSIRDSIKGALEASGRTHLDAAAADRTDRDLPLKWILGATLVLLIPIAIIYHYFTGSWSAAIVAAIVMSVTGFLLSALGGYLVGLVGASNQPLSGLTLAALVITALLLLTVGVSGKAGVTAVLGVAAVVACATSVSGSLIQDLKAGHLLGGTPWKMQVVEIAAVVLLSFFLMAPIIVLHEASAGGIGGRELPAPQAGLMAQLAKGIVGGQMAWGLIAIGAALGVMLLLCDAKAPMLIAVGMYLPFDTSSAIFLGGVIRAIADRFGADEERGTLLASGLVAGEAIVGILLAVTFVAGIPSFTRVLTGADTLGFYEGWGSWLSLIGFAALAFTLIRIPRKPARPAH
ncbi:MAG: oligopeptide transporter, OPT family [Bryobacterales bacterium]|nr:oligopeptide transporter, OPT family [Bryobacterales bacterium]